MEKQNLKLENKNPNQKWFDNARNLTEELSQEWKILNETELKNKILDWITAVGVLPADTRGELWEQIKNDTGLLTNPVFQNTFQEYGSPAMKQNLADIYTLVGIYTLTDIGNCERLVTNFGSEIRWCDPENTWYYWDGKRWAIDTKKMVQNYAKMTIKRMYAQAGETPDDEGSRRLAAHALRSHTRQRVDAMIALARSDVPIVPNEMDCDPWVINLENGTLDLRTGELKRHRREDMITKLAPVNFNPKAKYLKWIEFIKKITKGNDDLGRFLQRAVGYSLTGKVSEQKLFFCFGPTATGKSTFLLTIQNLLGDYAIKTEPEFLLIKPNVGSHTTPLTDLKGCRMAITIEIQEGRRLAESMVKELTGGDRLRARRLYQNNQEWTPTHKIWLAANHKPIVHETTQAIWRRIDIIPFVSPVPKDEQIKDFYEVLLTEREGILNWAIEGCLEWQRIKGLAEPEEVEKATQEYKTQSDILGDFIDDYCIIGQRQEVSSKDLYNAYVRWAEENGEKPITQTSFSIRLQEKGFIRSRTGKTRLWKGIGLTENG